MKLLEDTTASRRYLLAGAMVIVIACFVAYIPAIKGGFIWDDDKFVTNNALLTAPNGLRLIWFSKVPQLIYLHLHPMCRLVYTTFWVEHQLWGFNPMGYHLVNVAIHIANALLLWLILRRLAIPGAWFASIVFALHPVNVESVAWVTERKNVLVLFFSLLTVLCWMKFALDDKSGRRGFYVGSLLLFGLALLSKATACTLPAALVLILWLKRSPLTLKRWLQIVPFVAMGLGMGLFVMWWEKYHEGTGTINLGLTPEVKILIAGRALWFYLWKLFWPVNLTFSYPRWHIDPTAIWQYAWPAASILVLGSAWRWQERIGRPIVTAILFFPAMLFTMLGFFYIFTYIYSFVADHYQYVACIGPIALVAAGGAIVFRRAGKSGKIALLSSAGVLLLVLGVLTWRQCRIYTNEKTLWEDTLNKNPDSWMAHGRISKLIYMQGKFNDAKIHLERAIELASYMKTISPFLYAGLYGNMGVILEAQGKMDDAVSYYQKSLDLADYRLLVQYRLAVVLAKKSNFEMALPHLRRALELAKAEKNDRLVKEISRLLGLLEEKTRNPGDRQPIPWSVLDSSYQEQYKF